MSEGTIAYEEYRTSLYSRACEGYDPSREMTVRELPSGIIEIHDPTWSGGSYRFGDRSLISDPAADDFANAMWYVNPLSRGISQLTSHPHLATKFMTAAWSREAHMISATAHTARLGGSALQIMQSRIHDIAHRVGQHRTDDLLQGRGLENSHDFDMPNLVQRAGFAKELMSAGIIGLDGKFTLNDDITMEDVLGRTNASTEPSFVDQPSRTRSCDVDRLQYTAGEALLWINSPEDVREALSYTERRSHAEHGEHVVFSDSEAASLMARAYVRMNSEHWNDSYNDIIDELVMTLDRRVLTSSYTDIVGTYTTAYYPGDVMYASESEWFETYQKLAESDAFTSAILKIVTTLASHQREVHSRYDNKNLYTGPQDPEWAYLKPAVLGTKRAHTAQGIHKSSGSTLQVEMMPGKKRGIDPWVVSSTGLWRRVSDIQPDVADHILQQSQWIATDSYDGVIKYDHASLKLTAAEKRAIPRGIDQIRRQWAGALARTAMPDDQFAARIQQTGKRITAATRVNQLRAIGLSA